MRIFVLCYLSLLGTFFSSNLSAHQCEKNEATLWGKGPEYQRVANHIASLFQCINTNNPSEYILRDRTACNWFTGKAIEVIYGYNSFKNGAGYFTANQIATGLAGGRFHEWQRLGPANQQQALTLAGSLVEQGKPVVAAWASEQGHGHVNILMPGGLASSSSWGLDVPNSANISLDDISRSYIGCRLSFSFSKNKINHVYLYSIK